MSDPQKSAWTRHFRLPRIVTVKRIRKALFGVACLGTLVALFYAEENLRGKRAWENYAGERRARGFELDWRAYVPAPVRDDQNFATTPLFADLLNYEYTKTNTHWHDTNIWKQMERESFQPAPRLTGMPPLPRGEVLPAPTENLDGWLHGQPVDLKEWQAYFRRWRDYSQSFKSPETNNWSAPEEPLDAAHDVLFALKRVDPDLAQLREAAMRPESRFPIHYEEIAKAMLPHLAYLKNFSMVLQLRAVAELNTGNSQQAFADTMLTFRCADAIESEPFIISQFVRCRIIEGGLQSVWEGLSAHSWSESQLGELQRYFSRQDLLSSHNRSVKADVAFMCGWIDSLSDDPSSLDVIDDAAFPNGVVEALLAGHVLPRGWMDQNEVSGARFFSETLSNDVVPAMQRVYPDLSAINVSLFEHLPTNTYNFAFKHVSAVISPHQTARTQTEINLALVACALERFRMARGRFPETLEAMGPEFLDKLPHDIINGEPLHYRLAGNGMFTLYSVGWDGRDDGGMFPVVSKTVSKSFRSLFTYQSETGDWVWRYPEEK